MKYIVILFLVFLMQTAQVSAQCAMCRATVESNVANQNGAGKGLNTGILYLMTIPYILIGTLAYLWYNSSRKETERQNKIFEVLRRKLT